VLVVRFLNIALDPVGFQEGAHGAEKVLFVRIDPVYPLVVDSSSDHIARGAGCAPYSLLRRSIPRQIARCKASQFIYAGFMKDS
jgi:hypothetical protein